MSDEDITALLERLQAGDEQARQELAPLVYDELHRIARVQRARWVGDDTLNATALVHEAYERLIERTGAAWVSREHFYSVAARGMRNLLVSYARKRRALKRGGANGPPEDSGPAMNEGQTELVLAVHQALEKLEARSADQARLVEYRFFGGLQTAEIAALLGVTERTVRREWTRARAWLALALGEDSERKLTMLGGSRT